MAVPTNRHYDIEPQFFKHFLDKKFMKYTSGLFQGDSTPEIAAAAMLDKHINFLEQYKTPQILEVGPGWGAFLRRIKERNIKTDYTAINPSMAQNNLIKNEIDANVKIIFDTFENHNFENRQFDVIFFIGSFCHMADFSAQLKKAKTLLREGGRIIIEDVFFLNEDIFNKHHGRPETHFVQNEVFGFAMIPSLSKMIEEVNLMGLGVKSLHDHTQDYFKTIQNWLNELKKLNHNYTQPFIKYLTIAQKGWDYTIGNYILEIECRKRAIEC